MRAGPDWLLLDGGPSGDWLVPGHSLVVVDGLGSRAVPPAARRVPARLSLASVLRELADHRHSCVLHLPGGRTREGVLGRVGADFVELSAGQRSTCVVPFAQLVAVQERS